jgi:Putative auto-transporter adhesin, head GIN domain
MRSAIGLTGLLVLAACSGSNAATTNSGPAGTRNFTPGAFTAVALEGSDDVRVVTGATPGVVATGPEAELATLDIRVEGSTLKIGRKRESWGINWSNRNGVTVTVTTPGITGAAIGGSGDMSIDKVRGEKFEGSIGGSGNLEVGDVDVRAVNLSIAGSGDTRAKGKAASIDVSVAGSGDIDVAALASETAEIAIAGSGNVRAAASKSAKISIVGSGDAEVKGTSDCSISKIGSGEAKCAP